MRETSGHKWHRHRDGKIDISYWGDRKSGHEGPECTVCKFHYCFSCNESDPKKHPITKCRGKLGKLKIKDFLKG